MNNTEPTSTLKKESIKRDRTKSSRTKLSNIRKKSSEQVKSGSNSGGIYNVSPKGFVKIRDNKTLNDPIVGSESYSKIDENSFKLAGTNPLSTFSVDVDRAAYSNVRRFINNLKSTWKLITI